MTDLDRMLERVGACREARRWAAQFATLDEAWDACTDPGWMLWLADRTRFPQEAAVRMAVAFARRVLPFATGDAAEPARIAIETAERWLRGEATVEECRAASYAARAAGDAAWAAVSAAWAADRAAQAADRAAQCQIIRSIQPRADWPGVLDALNQKEGANA